MATKGPMRMVDSASPFAPMKDLQASLKEFEGLPDKTPTEQMELEHLRQVVADRQAGRLQGPD